MDKIKYTSQLKEAFALIGSIGGKAAASKMTPEQRLARAQKASAAAAAARTKKKADREAL